MNHISYTRENIEREFTKNVKKKERVDAVYSCRICGTIYGWLQCAHIYSYTLNIRWKRNGTKMKNWKNDKYVSSYKNCLLLCKTHHKEIDSKNGLYIYNVKYLKSLKLDNNRCTAVRGDKNKRCKHKTIDGKYKCSMHNVCI